MIRDDIFRLIVFFYSLFILVILIGCESNNLPPAKPRSTHPIVISKTQRIQDWPMFMSDLKQSGQSNDKKIIPPLKLKWKFKTGGKIQASPVVVEDIVYIGSTDHSFYALG